MCTPQLGTCVHKNGHICLERLNRDSGGEKKDPGTAAVMAEDQHSEANQLFRSGVEMSLQWSLMQTTPRGET